MHTVAQHTTYARTMSADTSVGRPMVNHTESGGGQGEGGSGGFETLITGLPHGQPTTSPSSNTHLIIYINEKEERPIFLLFTLLWILPTWTASLLSYHTLH